MRWPSLIGDEEIHHKVIFTACGGTQKGITLKDVICGLVLLTRGKEDEKLKLIECFQKERLSYEEFREWLQVHPDATSLSRWLLSEPCTVTLSNELETPTFYQTLAGVTHLEEMDIIELEKRYWQLKGQSRTGKLDLDTLVPLISPPVPLSICPGVFAAFDENRDSHIDFKEMACGISAACRGPLTERQKFCFKVFDVDRDGILSEEEAKCMIEVLLFVRHENKSAEDLSMDPYGQVDSDSILADICQHGNSGGLTMEEYLIWSMDNPLPMDFLNLLFQSSDKVATYPLDKEGDRENKERSQGKQQEHAGPAVRVVKEPGSLNPLGPGPAAPLALPLPPLFWHWSFDIRLVGSESYSRPVSREEESNIVHGWLDREERRGYKVGQFWYLINIDWWKTWLEYVSYVDGYDSPVSGYSSNSPISGLGSSLKHSEPRRLYQHLNVADDSLALDNSSVVPRRESSNPRDKRKTPPTEGLTAHLRGTLTTNIHLRTVVKQTFHSRHTTRHTNEEHQSENRGETAQGCHPRDAIATMQGSDSQLRNRRTQPNIQPGLKKRRDRGGKLSQPRLRKSTHAHSSKKEGGERKHMNVRYYDSFEEGEIGSTRDNGTRETTQRPAIDPSTGVNRQITCYFITSSNGNSTTHASIMASNIQQCVFFSHTNMLILIHTSSKVHRSHHARSSTGCKLNELYAILSRKATQYS
uniref:Ubiquitin carboxyl-terminal hydrolase 32 n=1 Tax=Timema californicum TaxID=61474 RepID=A0A7R9P545_TIMCA|nr:unnamed protein product [Timema californicum]